MVLYRHVRIFYAGINHNYHVSLARVVPVANPRKAGATGTVLSITKQECVMSQNPNLGSFQYMVDVGVPQDDVVWLRSIAGTPSAQLTPVAARIKRIQETAYQCLLLVSLPQSQPAYQ